MKKVPEENYNILAEENEKEQKRREFALFLLFALCFLIVSFTATFSFIRLKSIIEPTIDVIDPSSEETNKPTKPTKPGNNNQSSTNNESSNNSSSTNTNISGEETSGSSSQTSSQNTPTQPDKPTETKMIKVVYKDGTEINSDSGVLPGWVSREKELSVINMNDVQLKYKIVWTKVTNTFVRNSDFVYHISIGGNEIASGALPKNEEVLANNITLRAKEKQVIKIYVEYKNLPLDQSVDMNRMFKGTVMVKNVE